MQIQVTEHKSVGTLNPVSRAVRVFVDRDYAYGYFVDEHALFGLLDSAQQEVYLAQEDVRLEVSPAVAQRIIDKGVTPYAKRRVL